jgi:hypothetical protein
MQAPSKAHLWTRCALSGGTGGGYATPYAPEESDHRREGSAAHWLAGEMLGGRVENESCVGMVAPNGWAVDAEMEHYVRDYMCYVESWRGELVPPETAIRIGDHIGGRVDTGKIDHDNRLVHVFDFKYGWRLVEVEQNPELLCYGVAIALPLGYNIMMHIVQPRPHHPDGPTRTTLVPCTKVPEWRAWLVARAEFAEGLHGDPIGTPGEHCRDCSNRATCAALAANVYAQFEQIADTRLTKMTAEQLAVELDFIDRAETLVKERKAGLEAEAEGRMTRGGEFIPGWEMQPKTGHRKFTVPMAQVQMMTGVMPFKQVEMSPAEIERAGAKKDIVKQITHTPVIGRKLARTSVKMFERLFRK